MKSVLLGTDQVTSEPVRIPKSAFGTHFHFIGGTGKGKTTAIHTLLWPLLRDPTDRSCFILIDRLGNLSEELLLWMSSPHYCTDYVRERLVYVEPAREDVVLPFNPLLFDTQAHGFFKVERATEIVLRAWESVDIEAMPRLARWTFNAFWSAAQLGLTIADCWHFLQPASKYHKPLLRLLPEQLQVEWHEVAHSHSAEATRLLESSRNRLKPYFESDILRRMFGSCENRLDIAGFMREGKIVVLNLARKQRLGDQLANTIGALVLNEIIATARNLPRRERYSTYVFLDEFQNFVGPDLADALPEVRQMGLKFLLSHQSLDQLERGDYDLTNLIFQAQSRLVFGVQGEDADRLAHEFASINYDPKKIKDEVYSRRQLVKEQKVIELSNWSDATQEASNWQETYGTNWNRSSNETQSPSMPEPTKGRGEGIGGQEGIGRGGNYGRTSSHGRSQAVVPVYEEFQELSSRTYETFDEQKAVWARDIRNLKTGQALLRLVDDDCIRRVNVKRSAHSYLRHDAVTLAQDFPELIDRMEELVARNFEQEMFSTGAQIDEESDARLDRIIGQSPISASSNGSDESLPSTENPFA